MLEVYGDLFEPPIDEVAAICLTTNNIVNRRGHAVMGRGVALQAKQRWPGIDKALGNYLKRSGFGVRILTFAERKMTKGPLGPLFGDRTGRLFVSAADWTALDDRAKVEVPFHILSFPVKHHWRDKADLDLIRASAQELKDLARSGVLPDGPIALPRPGCGVGGLRWDEVRPILASILDDRFIVMENNP